jgi:CspA family cold shock protein
MLNNGVRLTPAWDFREIWLLVAGSGFWWGLSFRLTNNNLKRMEYFKMHGSVRWFSDQKGYGFLTGEDGNDYFIHFSNINGEGFKTLRQDDQVSFEVEQGSKGPEASNVTVL